MFVGRRYRLYPTPTQEQKMSRFCGARRFIYNLGLEQRMLAHSLARIPKQRIDTYFRGDGEESNSKRRRRFPHHGTRTSGSAAERITGL